MSERPRPNEDPGDTPPPGGNETPRYDTNNQGSQNVRDRLSFIMHEMRRRNGIVHVDFLELNGTQYPLTSTTAQGQAPPNGPGALDGGEIAGAVRRFMAEHMGGPIDGSNNFQGAAASTTASTGAAAGAREGRFVTPPNFNTANTFVSEYEETTPFGAHRVRPMPPAGTVYFISIQEEEQDSKASDRALQSLRRVPLAEIATDERECTICYEPLTEPPSSQQDPAEEDHSPLAMPECKHFFGASCLRSWLQTAASCPLCRTHIESEAETRSSRFPRFGTSMPFFFDRLHSHDPSRDPSLTPSRSNSPHDRGSDSNDSAVDSDNNSAHARTSNNGFNPSNGFMPEDNHSAFERDVGDILNSFRDTEANAAENADERNMAFVRVIETVLRQVANRVVNSERGVPRGFANANAGTDANDMTRDNTGASPANTSASSTMPSSAMPAEADQNTANRSQEQQGAARRNDGGGLGPFGLRQFIRIPQNPIPSLAELRARQSDVMRRAFDQSWFGARRTQPTSNIDESRRTAANSTANDSTNGATDSTANTSTASPTAANTAANPGSAPDTSVDTNPRMPTTSPAEPHLAHSQSHMLHPPLFGANQGMRTRPQTSFGFHLHHPIILPSAHGPVRAPQPTEPTIQTTIQTTMEPSVQPSLQPSMEPSMGSSMGSSVQPSLGSSMGSSMGPPMGPPMQPSSNGDADGFSASVRDSAPMSADPTLPVVYHHESETRTEGRETGSSSSAETDIDENPRSGPSRRQTQRRHPYQRNNTPN